MKTTIDIADDLFTRTKEVSKARNLTFRELVESGLLLVLNEASSHTPYRASPVTFSGKGLSPEFQGVSWSVLRDAAYEGHGS